VQSWAEQFEHASPAPMHAAPPAPVVPVEVFALVGVVAVVVAVVAVVVLAVAVEVVAPVLVGPSPPAPPTPVLATVEPAACAVPAPVPAEPANVDGVLTPHALLTPRRATDPAPRSAHANPFIVGWSRRPPAKSRRFER
jgi:hypothetical protein